MFLTIEFDRRSATIASAEIMLSESFNKGFKMILNLPVSEIAKGKLSRSLENMENLLLSY
jgi:hypothetical protein